MYAKYYQEVVAGNIKSDRGPNKKTEGIGISQGQRQRLLITRAIYINPEFIFLDEATNALEANSESKIVQNLERFFFKEKTVVVVAHRLSTVRNAANYCT